MSESIDVLSSVRRALGRSSPLVQAPIPPLIADPIVRLVHSDIGLPELFAKRAEENKMHVEAVYAEEVPAKLIAFLKEKKCHKLAMPTSSLLDQLGLFDALQAGDFHVRRWSELTLDELYD